MIKIFIVSLLLFLNLHADYKEGKEIFDNKCASCHSGYVDLNSLKENFFAKNNKLLNLKAPTVNMIAYAIMDSPKKIGDAADPEMQEIEIEKYLKTYLENPDIFNTICDEHILSFYDKKQRIKLEDDEYNNLAIFFMEYKKHLEIKDEVKDEFSSKDEEKILKKAKDENKQIIVYATAKSCFFCKKMDKEVLGLDDIKNLIKKDYVFVKNDMDESALPFDLQKVYKKITPTFFILSKDGKYIKQYPGSWTKSDFIEILNENLK